MSEYLPGDGRARIEGDISGEVAEAARRNGRSANRRGGKSRVQGARELRAKLRRMPDALREEVRAVNAYTAEATHARGLQLMDDFGIGNVTGTLRKQYRWKVSRDGLSARVGYLTKAARRRAYYAMFLHNGTRFIVSRPWHQTAVDETRLRWATNLRSMISELVHSVDRGDGRRTYQPPRWKRRR